MMRLNYCRNIRQFVFLLCCLLSSCIVLLLTSCPHEPEYTGSAAGAGSGWTTVVYMAADNDLEGDALDDFNEMAAAAAVLKDADHTVLVLLDRASGYDASSGDWTDTRLFCIGSGKDDPDGEERQYVQLDCLSLGLTVGTRTELDMSSPQTLERVLSFAQQEFPADNYALVIWGHGSGWRGYAVDEESGSLMSLPKLHEAVSSLEVPLSVIAFDCCYGAMLETAYELRNDAQLLVAPERDEPAAGWNYTYLLQNLTRRTELASGTQAERYVRCVVDAFSRQYADSRGVSITAVRLNKIDDVFKAFDSFSKACAACLTSRDLSLSFSSEILTQPASFLMGEYPSYRFIDIQGMTDAFLEQGLLSGSTNPDASASAAAVALEQSLQDATLMSFSGGAGISGGLSETPMLAVYLATVREGGVVDAEYPQLYVRGSGVSGQCSFVRDSTGWVPQYVVSQSTSLLDHLYRMPLP